MKNDGTYEGAYSQRADAYSGYSQAEIDEEIAAQYFGVVFSSESNIRRVIENSSQQELSMWKKIVEHLKDFVKRIKDAIERYAVEDKTVRAALKADADTVEELARQFDVCLKEAAKNKKPAEQVQGGEKKSVEISENVPSVEQIEEVRKIGRKSINSFESAEIEKTQYWAKMFWDKLKTKSPFFRAWFGDWREYDTKEFEPLGTVQLIDAKNKHEAEQYIKYGIKNKTLFRGDVKNADTDFVINVGTQVYNDTLAYLNRRYSRNKKFDEYIAKLSLLNEIEKITQNAILLNSFVADSEKNPYQSFFHKFYTIANVGKNDYLVRLTVDELNSTDEPVRRAYNINGIKITPIAGIQVYKPAYTMGDSGDSISTISISKLFDIVKQNDEEFKPNPVNPAFLNEDGTPKVFYHGTNAQFTEFDRKKAKSSGLYGRGFYFTDSPSHAGQYGKAMAVYLKSENTLEPGKNNITKEELHRFLEAVAKNEDDYDIWNYGTADIDEILNSVYRNDAFAVIQDVNATAIGDFAEAIRLFNDVNGTSYDCVKTATETVVYKSEQIKSATDNIGTFDKGNPDIRYSKQITQQTEDNIEQLALENEALRELLDSAKDVEEELRNRLDAAKKMNRTTRGLIPDKTELFRIVRKYNHSKSGYTNAELVKYIDNIMWDLRDKQGDSNTLINSLTALMQDLLETSESVNRDLYEQYADFRKYFRGSTLYVNQKVYDFLLEEYGSKKNLRNVTLGKLNIKPMTETDSGTTLTQAYQDIVQYFPELLNPEVDESIRIIKKNSEDIRYILGIFSYS